MQKFVASEALTALTTPIKELTVIKSRAQSRQKKKELYFGMMDGVAQSVLQKSQEKEMRGTFYLETDSSYEAENSALPLGKKT